MRGSVVLVLGVLAIARASGADDDGSRESDDGARGPQRWQAASGAPALTKIWGSETLYGVGPSGAYRSTDNGATWAPVDGAGPATGVWGADSDVWIVRARTLHHTFDGASWTTQSLPMLSFGAAMEGMWGIDRDRYVFGVDRVDGKPRGTILRSRDGGTTFRAESIPEVERIAGVWGRAANDVYAVGSKGIILHSTGDGWTTVRAATGSTLEAIWGNASGIYAVGANGTILYSTDGKAWSPRQSGVRYTLTSINGGAELYAGSSDGAPLRSLDGVTWKPVTALIERGNVWTGGARPVLASAEVKFLGETAPLVRRPVPVPNLPAGTKLATGTAQLGTRAGQRLDLEADRYGNQYPYARSLFSIAANRLGSSRALDPGLQLLTLPRLTVGSVTGCSQAVDRQVTNPPEPATNLMLDATCTWRSCGEVSIIARVKITGIKGPAFLSTGARVVGACNARDRELMAQDALEAVSKAVMGSFQKRAKETLDQALKNATKPDQIVDALAAYVLVGGTDQSAQQKLATLVNQPISWSGFPWNQSMCMDKVTLGATIKRGEDMLQAGNFDAATTEFLSVLHCERRLLSKTYLASCRAKRFGEAKAIFEALGSPASLTQICTKEGFDPRNPTQPSPAPPAGNP